MLSSFSLLELAVAGRQVPERDPVTSGLRQHHRDHQPADVCPGQDLGLRAGPLLRPGERLQRRQDRERVLLRQDRPAVRTEVHLRRSRCVFVYLAQALFLSWSYLPKIQNMVTIPQGLTDANRCHEYFARTEPFQS